jgi:hypothetical protein
MGCHERIAYGYSRGNNTVCGARAPGTPEGVPQASPIMVGKLDADQIMNRYALSMHMPTPRRL